MENDISNKNKNRDIIYLNEYYVINSDLIITILITFFEILQ